MARFDLTDEEWAIIKPPLPPQVRGPERKDDRKFSTAFSSFCEPVRLGVICRIGMVREPRSTTATAVGASEGFGETVLPSCSPDLTGLSVGHEHSDQHAAPEGVPLFS